jgi:hypothetical protein
VAHFAGEQFMTLFGLLAAPHVKEDAEHSAVDDAGVGALATGGDPADLMVEDNPEVDFVSAGDRPRGEERRPDAIAVRRVDVSRERLELDFRGRRQTPEFG